MKKTFKYLSLLLAGFTVIACSDEDILNDSNRKVYHSGDEIEFSVSASVKSGNDAEKGKNSRTSYGDVSVENGVKKIAINWEPLDQIDVSCQEALGAQQASYQVPQTEGNKSTVTKMERISAGEYGLRWDGSNPDKKHNFYAIYPSKAKLESYPEIVKDRPKFSYDPKTKKATGYMPMNYTARVVDKVEYKDQKSPSEVSGEFVKCYTVKPNMDYAFMVAKNSLSLNDVNGVNKQQLPNKLSFEPLATVLDFDITTNSIGLQNAIKPYRYIVLERVELVSSSQNITGDFEYDFTSNTLTNTSSKAPQGAKAKQRNISSLHLAYAGIDSTNLIKLSEKDTCKVTFFLMPDKNLDTKTLKVRVWYRVKVAGRVVTATINQPLNFKHKYYFKDFKLPTVAENIEGTNWFSAVEPEVYLNQLSMICAGNAFSSDKTLPWYTRQQVKGYKELWNYGVRAFEFVTQTTGVQGKNSPANTTVGLANEHFVCGELEMDGTHGTSETFEQAYADLAQYLVDPNGQFKNETLIILARYHAVNDGFSPSRYVAELAQFLDYAATTGITTSDKKNIVVPKDKYVHVKAGITAGDMKGKIAIIVRPGDDDYCRISGVQSTGDALANNDKNKAIVDKWKDVLCYVTNWGSAYDRWDTRYAGYARESTWNRTILEGETRVNPLEIEDYTWGLSRDEGAFKPLYLDYYGDGDSRNTRMDSNTSYIPNWKPFKEHPETSVTATGDLAGFHATINNSPNGGYIQEWARVIPDDGLSVCARRYSSDTEENLGYNYNYRNHTNDDRWETNAWDGKGWASIWYCWQGSYTEKLNAIKNVVNKAVTVQSLSTDPMCINVLSGYFADVNQCNSFEPYRFHYDVNINNGIESPFISRHQGNGGNYAALAANLNVALFKYLTETKELKHGPWGLVMVDYLGATADDFTNNAGPSEKSDLHGGNAKEAAIKTGNLLKLFIANNFTFPLHKNPNWTPTKPDANIENGGGTDQNGEAN